MNGPSYPLAPSQEPMWEQMRFLNPADPGDTFLNNALALRWEGELRLPALRRALAAVVARHRVLRVHLSGEGWAVRQRVMAETDVPMPVVDLTGADGPDRLRRAQELAIADDAAPFDVWRGPLHRAQVLRLAPDDHVLLLAFPFLILDGPSGDRLLRELHACYRAALRDTEPELPPVAGDFLSWARRAQDPADLGTRLSYWRDRLPDVAEPLPLPTARARPTLDRFRYAVHPFRLPPALWYDVTAACVRQRASVFMLMLSAYAVLLFRRTGHPELTLGTLVGGRDEPTSASLVGYTPTAAFVRVVLSARDPFDDLLARVRDEVRGAAAHHCAYYRIAEQLSPGRLSAGSWPPAGIHQASFQFGVRRRDGSPTDAPYRVRPFGFDVGELASREVVVGDDPLRREVAARENPGFEMAGGGSGGVVQYNDALFTAPDVERLVDDFQAVLAAVVARPGVRLADIPLSG